MPDRAGVPVTRTPTRRGLLGAGAVAAVVGLAACDSGTPQPRSPNPTGTTSSTPSRGISPATKWSTLGRAVQGRLLMPEDAAYRQARLTENPRYDGARPLAVLLAASAADIARAFAFAQENDVPVRLRSGGHCYAGWSSGGGGDTGQPATLVIDCRAMNQVTLDGTTATVGAGASLAAVYQGVGSRGRAIPGGSCATVGIAGLTQGGGVGVLTRALGLTCDRVTAMQVVLADGTSATASPEDHDDLFWALRGGGGGHLGMVTSFTFDTVDAPRVATYFLQWQLAMAPQVIPAWQEWIEGADPRLWSTMKALGASRHPAGPVLSCAGTWIGPAPMLRRQLARLLKDVPRPGVDVTGVRSYLDAMRSYAGCSHLPASQCHTGPGGGLRREAFAATSHVGYVPLDDKGIATVLDTVASAPDSLLEAGLSMDALGGKVAEVAPGATAFVHRRARTTVQYTATYVGGNAATAADFVHGFRASMTPVWGNHAYVNYVDASLPDYRRAYFGDNASRLAGVRKAYDPNGFFTQPQEFR